MASQAFEHPVVTLLRDIKARAHEAGLNIRDQHTVSNTQELWVDRFQVQRISRMDSLSIAASPVLSAPSWSGPVTRTRTGVPGCSSA